MKKFLLSLAAGLLCVGSALADATVVIADTDPFSTYAANTNLTADNNNTTFTSGDFTFTVDKGAGQTNPAYNFAGKDLRLYAKNTITVSAPANMTKIVFNLSAQGLKRLAPVTASEGAVAAQAAGDQTVTWTGEATSVIFTVGDTSDFGSETGKGGQFDFASVEILGGGEGGSQPGEGGGDQPGEGGGDQPVVEPAGSGTLESPYNVAKAIDLINAGAYEDEDVYTKGVITGVKEISTSYGNATYYIGDAATSTATLTVFRGLWLGGEAFTSEDQLAVGAEVIVVGKLKDYNGTPEIDTGNRLYSYNGQTAGETPVVPSEDPVGTGTQEDPYNCAKVIELNPTSTSAALETEVWVKAYIVGTMPNGSINTMVFGVENAVATNLVLGPSADCAEKSLCISLQLPSGNIRSGLNLVDNPSNLGKELLIKGDIYKYCSVAGIKNPTEYVLGGEGGGEQPDPDTTAFELATAIVSGAEYIMVVDGQVGQAISASSSYGRLSLVDATENDGKIETDIANALVIAEVQGGYTIKDAHGRFLGFDSAYPTSFQLYAEECANAIWNIAFTNGEAAITITVNDVTGTVGVTKGTNGTWYTNIAPSVGAEDIKLPALYIKSDNNSVDSIVVAGDATVEYFNLQGVRVANPACGLYIRRCGNNVSKVYLQ